MRASHKTTIKAFFVCIALSVTAASPVLGAGIAKRQMHLSVENPEINVTDIRVNPNDPTAMRLLADAIAGLWNAGKPAVTQVEVECKAVEWDPGVLLLDPDDIIADITVAVNVPANYDGTSCILGALDVNSAVLTKYYNDGWFGGDPELKWYAYSEETKSYIGTPLMQLNFDVNNPNDPDVPGSAMQLTHDCPNAVILQAVAGPSDDGSGNKVASIVFYNSGVSSETFNATFTQQEDFGISLSQTSVVVPAGQYGEVIVTASKTGSRKERDHVQLSIQSIDSSQQYLVPIDFEFPGTGEPTRYLFPSVRTLEDGSGTPLFLSYIGVTNTSSASVTYRVTPYNKLGSQYLDSGSNPVSKEITVGPHVRKSQTLYQMFPTTDFDADGQNPVLIEVIAGAGKIIPHTTITGSGSSFLARAPVTEVSGSEVNFPLFGSPATGIYDSFVVLTNTNPSRSITVDVQLYDQAGAPIGTTTPQVTIPSHGVVAQSIQAYLDASGASSYNGFGSVKATTSLGERSLTGVLFFLDSLAQLTIDYVGPSTESSEEL